MIMHAYETQGFSYFFLSLKSIWGVDWLTVLYSFESYPWNPPVVGIIPHRIFASFSVLGIEFN